MHITAKYYDEECKLVGLCFKVLLEGQDIDIMVEKNNKAKLVSRVLGEYPIILDINDVKLFKLAFNEAIKQLEKGE
jgi:hypothetical protein